MEDNLHCPDRSPDEQRTLFLSAAIAVVGVRRIRRI
jgi:hypothetical protein